MPSTVRCPTCRKEATWDNNPYRPFCSERCRLIDLGAWIEERYRVPTEDSESHAGDDDEDGKTRSN